VEPCGTKPWGSNSSDSRSYTKRRRDHHHGHKPTTCARSPESQRCPGLHQKQPGWQVNGEVILPLCSALVDPAWSTASSYGALSTGKTWTCGIGSRGGPENDQRAGAPLLMKKNECCSAWRKEGSGDSLLQPFSTYSGLIRKKRTNFLPGPVVTGQGVMFLN